MRNGVAIADFFRISYINKYGGYWFDIDLKPFKVNIPDHGKIHLFDCGYGNISYMFIGGKPNQPLFNDVIHTVVKNINDNINIKKKHVMDITGPRIIQNLILNVMGKENKDGVLKGEVNSTVMLPNHKYEFVYTLNKIYSTKRNTYHILQNRYNKKRYQAYNYL